MLAIDEVVNHAALDWSRSIQRVESGQVFNRMRLVAPQHVAHAMRFKLEDARGQTLVEDLLIGVIIIQWQIGQLQLLTARLRNQLDRVVQNRERGKPEKI